MGKDLHIGQQLYTVTVTDLGTYKVTVAANTEWEAQNIAKHALLEEAFNPTHLLSTIKRESEAIAEVAEKQPPKVWRVESRYCVDFELDVTATTQEEAITHAKRLYAGSCPATWCSSVGASRSLATAFCAGSPRGDTPRGALARG